MRGHSETDPKMTDIYRQGEKQTETYNDKNKKHVQKKWEKENDRRKKMVFQWIIS